MEEKKLETYYNRLTRINFDMEEVLADIESGELDLDTVMSVALSTHEPQSRYSAWIISHYLLRGHSIEYYESRAIDFLYTTHISHTGHIREMLRWFSIAKPQNEKNSGRLVDFCFKKLTDFTMPTGVKCHAIDILEYYSAKEPELLPEFITVLQDIDPYMTRGGSQKIKKLLVQLTKQEHVLQ
ncbi:MAG: hypothetical protein PF481_11270 [Bacteroidales bacterium]|jgi:hypothetical protein|nr:hypothetical protein [Bacteroidales bacterium]